MYKPTSKSRVFVVKIIFPYMYTYISEPAIDNPGKNNGLTLVIIYKNELACAQITMRKKFFNHNILFSPLIYAHLRFITLKTVRCEYLECHFKTSLLR